MTAALYPCEITHVRAHPVRRTFRYRGYLWLVDLDDLPRAPLALRPFARFRAGDHLGDPASPIRANVDAYLARHGISLAGGRVLMLGHEAVGVAGRVDVQPRSHRQLRRGSQRGDDRGGR